MSTTFGTWFGTGGDIFCDIAFLCIEVDGPLKFEILAHLLGCFLRGVTILLFLCGTCGVVVI
eukprot:CAMPEP_0197238548 /NCGR_PEP_ID=MMETSP1429-20130617/5042_1 /TAXON_ID=49237 /ORGANISM="Chaetoceros  sp., Strain UNC1202" /LENGTH=61 /DNA_ID=CAMNT_0042697733 /DNA_START=352 /DNA_END=537 /DNA_ORIENTATION=+